MRAPTECDQKYLYWEITEKGIQVLWLLKTWNRIDKKFRVCSNIDLLDPLVQFLCKPKIWYISIFEIKKHFFRCLLHPACSGRCFEGLCSSEFLNPKIPIFENPKAKKTISQVNPLLPPPWTECF